VFEFDAAKAAADAVLDFCARRGMTEEAKDLI
jgi:pentatricopeptide repeat protein